MAFVKAAGLGVGGLALASVALGVAYTVLVAVYRLFFHPLRAFPGPVSHRISIFPRISHQVVGNLPFHVEKLHLRYGPIVRIAPNELAFSDPQAWKDIYGHRAAGQEEFPKYQKFYRPDRLPPSIISVVSREEHGLIRRQLAHGFSDRSMRGQEPIIGAYVDLLIKRLHANAEGGMKPLNMRNWLNWATFDIIGDLGFGSSFGCLEDSGYHPWVSLITDNIRTGAYMGAIRSAGLGFMLKPLRVTSFMKKRATHRAIVKQKLEQRIELGAERPDFIEGLIKEKNGLNLSREELAMNASTLIIAGSETTATLLTGAIFLLTTHPETLAKLEHEVRSAFHEEKDITLLSVGDLHYMLACLNESLRSYPPVATGMPRQSPKGGATVMGQFIPEGTVTAVWQWAVTHDPNHWKDPYGFHPERFLGDPAFKGDKLDAMQPFSTGPRNCIGRNLAYAEMRLILAKIIFNFDMKLADDSRDWLRTQKAYALWDKPPLNVYLKPVTRE